MNGHEPATKQDLALVENRLREETARLSQETARLSQETARVGQETARLSQEIVALNERHEMLRSEMHHAFDHLQEAMRDGQTELSKAFYSFTESNQQRSNQLEGNQAALIVRIGTLESRVTELERKLNFPNFPTQ